MKNKVKVFTGDEPVGAFSEKACKVLFYIDGTLGVDFEGNGISFQCDSHKGDTVIVSYSGEFGKPDFKFKLK